MDKYGSPIERIRARDILTPEQLLALGQVAAEFGLLEAALNRWGYGIGLSLPAFTKNSGAKENAELLRKAVHELRERAGCPEDATKHLLRWLG